MGVLNGRGSRYLSLPALGVSGSLADLAVSVCPCQLNLLRVAYSCKTCPQSKPIMNLSEAYRTLGVPPNADETICKDAYKKLARKVSPACIRDISESPTGDRLQLHPDKNAGADTTARFQQVSAAYERTRSGHNLGEEVPDTKPAGGIDHRSLIHERAMEAHCAISS